MPRRLPTLLERLQAEEARQSPELARVVELLASQTPMLSEANPVQRMLERLNARTDHDVYVHDVGRKRLFDAKRASQFWGWVTEIGCTRCGLVVTSTVDEQQAILSGDQVLFRFSEDFRASRELEERECKLGMIRTRAGVARMR